jgi:hypothetical protein
MRTTREGAFPFTDGPRRVLAVRAAGRGTSAGGREFPFRLGAIRSTSSRARPARRRRTTSRATGRRPSRSSSSTSSYAA